MMIKRIKLQEETKPDSAFKQGLILGMAIAEMLPNPIVKGPIIFYRSDDV